MIGILIDGDMFGRIGINIHVQIIDNSIIIIIVVVAIDDYVVVAIDGGNGSNCNGFDSVSVVINAITTFMSFIIDNNITVVDIIVDSAHIISFTVVIFNQHVHVITTDFHVSRLMIVIMFTIV